MRYFVWENPYPGVDKNGCRMDSHCTSSMRVEECIAFERSLLLGRGVPFESLQDDEQLADEFKIINWAWVEERES